MSSEAIETEQTHAPNQAHPESIEVELRDPIIAAALAWLVPGLGHLYQGRTGKGILFMVCILATFCYGMYLGNNHVVYASMRQGDARLAYFCQIGVGLPAVPAMIQAVRLRSNPDVSGQFMAPPRLSSQPPRHPGDASLADWQRELQVYFELGTVYTMIAGLLNLLVIFDAYAGPLLILPTKPNEPAPPRREGA